MKNSSEFKNDIVIGSLLGDGTIDKSGSLQIWHGEKQAEYLLWKENLFKKQFKLTHYERNINLNGSNFIQVGFGTKCTPYLKNIRNYFYTPNKRINKKQLNKLTPLGLAIWYCDDGCLSLGKKRGRVAYRQLILNTQSFTYEENVIIQTYFYEKWGIKCKIHKDKKYFRIWMCGEEAYKFINIIKKYVPECMYYKLCFRYGSKKYNLNMCQHICKQECSNENCEYNII